MKNISTQANLENCPFCDQEAEIHARQAQQTAYGKLEDVPIGAVVVSTHLSGLTWARPLIYVPRCTDSKCVGRNSRAFATVEDAEKAWNKRAGGNDNEN